MKLVRNEKGFKLQRLKAFSYFGAQDWRLSNQELEELGLIYKLKPLICSICAIR